MENFMDNAPVSPTTAIADSDTVSLIDIIAVILRYRKLIIGLTMAVGVLTLLVFLVFIRPSKTVVVSVVPGRYMAQATYQIKDIPSEISGLLNMDITTMVQTYASSIGIVSEAFKKTIINKDKDYQSEMFVDPGSLEAYVQNNILKKTLKLDFSNKGVVSITFANGNPELSTAFIIELTKQIQIRIAASLVQEVRQRKETLSNQEQQILVAKKSDSGG